MKIKISLLTVLILLFSSCSHLFRRSDDNETEIHDEVNSVYYWKTTLRLDSTELDFISKNNIGRIYLRMFDVVREASTNYPPDATYPNATVKIDENQYNIIQEKVSHIEFVPVVYITLDALRVMNGNEDILAKNIVTRVRNMVQYNQLPNVGEIQLDCDWTQSTEDSFFRLCDSVRSNLSQLDLPWMLSSTIRLHQLSRRTPPVDRGVLMVYNTGSFDNPDAGNSIIDIRDVEPYLKHLQSYRLHLDIAYPTYSWQLMFRSRSFIGLTNGVNINDTTKFRSIDENRYIAQRDIPHNGKTIKTGDMIRSEVSRFDDINKVKRQIELKILGRPHSNIIYHLDSTNLSKYTSDEIQSIYTVGR